MIKSKQRFFFFFIGGFLAVFLGGFFGLLLGALFGGLFTAVIDIPKIYGGLPGYEGTGVLGLVLGASALLLGWIRARLHGRLRRDAYIILTITTAINFLIQDHLWMEPRWKFALFLPIIAQIFLLIFHTQDEF